MDKMHVKMQILPSKINDVYYKENKQVVICQSLLIESFRLFQTFALHGICMYVCTYMFI